MKSMKTLGIFSLALLLFTLVACHDENFLSKEKGKSDKLTLKSLTTSTDSTSADTSVYVTDSLDISVLLQKSFGATGTVTFQLVDGHNSVISSQTVSADSIETGQHWFAFKNIKPDTTLAGQKCKIRIKRSQYAAGIILWKSSPWHLNPYKGGISSVSVGTDFTFQFRYAASSINKFYSIDQLFVGYAYPLTSHWTWQEVLVK